MTKLMEWVAVLAVLAAVWLGLLTNNVQPGLVKAYPVLIQFLPVICLMAFLLYSFVIVMYRVFTFKTCTEAAAEIQKQIEEAKTDLTNKGFVFKT